jgi:hypothetical protein
MHGTCTYLDVGWLFRFVSQELSDCDQADTRLGYWEKEKRVDVEGIVGGNKQMTSTPRTLAGCVAFVSVEVSDASDDDTLLGCWV